MITIRFEIDPVQAAALKRFAEKVTHADAQKVLYPHVSRAVRSDQAYQMIAAFSRLDEALTDAGVRSWPWIETGSVEP